jgi:hypothetical protein
MLLLFLLDNGHGTMASLLLPQPAFLHYCTVYLLLSLWLLAPLGLLVSRVALAEGFSLTSHRHYRHHHHHHPDTASCPSSSSWSRRASTRPAAAAEAMLTSLQAALMGQEIPLMDVLNKDEFSNEMIQPLPSRQYPEEMRTLFLYGMPVKVPLHQAIMDDANDRLVIGDGSASALACFGNLAYKPTADGSDDSSHSLVGAIGCAAQILPIPLSPKAVSFISDTSEDQINAVLCRGWYRFIVRKVIQTVPFAVAIVDELVDDDSNIDTIAPQFKADASSRDDNSDDDEEDDDDEDNYAGLTPDQLEKRLVQGMRDYVQQQLDISNREMTPLELSILQGAGGMSAQRQAAEEMAAVLDVFTLYMVDENPAPAERYYMLAFLAAEMTNLENDIRREILVLTNGVQRLRVVLAAVEDKVGMARARQMAKSITAKSDEEEKDLQVGKPKLPPWALQIKKGMRIEYYWNEEYEWCVCELVKDPVLLDDGELIVTVLFEDDDMTRQLPFRADEKARWRPARMQ